MSKITFQPSRLPNTPQSQSQPTNQNNTNTGTTADNRLVSTANVEQKILTNTGQHFEKPLVSEDKKPSVAKVIQDLQKTYFTVS
jgi:hypothetical protein